MWESLRLFGNEDLIKAAIENGSLICVTDKSYIKEMVPELCSTAFFWNVRKERGGLSDPFLNLLRL